VSGPAEERSTYGSRSSPAVLSAGIVDTTHAAMTTACATTLSVAPSQRVSTSGELAHKRPYHTPHSRCANCLTAMTNIARGAARRGVARAPR
jgi:hypothetical protein